MTLARKAAAELIGNAKPRIAPPRPLRHELAAYRESAATLGITPMPWQDCAACYVTAIGPDDLRLYREIAVVVGRQNGKTTFTKPEILRRLRAGRHVMHIAQVRELPRIMFESLADALEEDAPNLFPRRRGKIIWPRRGAGSESIVLANGGSYRIAAAVSGGARGHSIDDLIIDELREMDSFDVVNAAKPAQRFSVDPQTIYLSNAGTDDSVILNSLRKRAAEGDPSLAYLEWSADPSYDASDRRGWVQANPAIGHYPQVLRDLERDYVAADLGGNMAGFETEALCRWMNTTREPFVSVASWQDAEGEIGSPSRPVMGISMDPSGTRASAAIAWLGPDDRLALRLLFDVSGHPIDTDRLGKDMRDKARELGVQKVGFDPLTDAQLARFHTRTESITGQKYANASARFVERVESKGLVWADCAAVGDDLTWTARKPHDESGSFQAVRANDDRPITAALAAVRAVWLASVPRPSPVKSAPGAVGF